jgi:flagellar biosynthesis chaperone FliJ
MSIQEIKRLERVLSVLEVERDSVRREMATVMTKRNILTTEQERLEGVILGIVEGHDDKKMTTVAHLHVREISDNAMLRLKEQKNKMIDGIKFLDAEEIAPVRARLDEAERRYGSVELLLERRREEAKQAGEKADGRRLDDIGALRWFDQNKRGDDSANSDEE